jgi:hypothetical protein
LASDHSLVHSLCVLRQEGLRSRRNHARPCQRTPRTQLIRESDNLYGTTLVGGGFGNGLILKKSGVIHTHFQVYFNTQVSGWYAIPVLPYSAESKYNGPA